MWKPPSGVPITRIMMLWGARWGPPIYIGKLPFERIQLIELLWAAEKTTHEATALGHKQAYIIVPDPRTYFSKLPVS